MNIFKSDSEKKSFVEVHSNPFLPDKVKNVMFWINSSDYLHGNTTYTANIEFANGNTTGEHKIKADNFVDLVQKVEAFLKTL